MNHLWALLLLLASWIERQHQQIQQKKEQEERDHAEDNPNAWFDAEFNADGRVHKPGPDATGTHKTNADQN